MTNNVTTNPAATTAMLMRNTSPIADASASLRSASKCSLGSVPGGPRWSNDARSLLSAVDRQWKWDTFGLKLTETIGR